MDKNDFKSTLVDVRKSYRLLYLYQRRVLDLVQFISNNLSLNYLSAWSKFSNSLPKAQKITLDKCSWDWLNMYFYEFHFAEIKEKSNIRLSIVLESDSGFFEESTEDKLDISNFKKAERSCSRLIFLCVEGDWHVPVNSFLIPELKKAHLDEYESDKDVNPYCIAKAFNLEEFINEDTTREKIGEFVTFANKKLRKDYFINNTDLIK